MRSMTLVLSLLLLLACPSPHPPETVDPPKTPSASAEITTALSANGLAYELRGDGPAVVLIHGTNLDRRMWDDEAAWLGESHRVLRYDQRGQGGSDFPEEAYSNHADLIALLDELEIGEATLVGLSAGAQTALDVALTAPERVRRLVLVSPSLMGYVPSEAPPFFAEMGAALQAGEFARANEVLLASPVMAVPEEHAARVRSMVTENERLWTIPYSLIELASPPAIERLAEVRAPALILLGEDDLAAVGEQGRLLAEQLPEATLITVPAGGHLLNLTSPGAFREAVGVFLEAAEN